MANPLDTLIVGGGQAFITESKQGGHFRTVTLNLSSGLCKLRNVEVCPAIPGHNAGLPTDQWVFVRAGNERLAINRSSLEKARDETILKSLPPGDPRAVEIDSAIRAIFGTKELIPAEPIAYGSEALESVQKAKAVFTGITPSFQSVSTSRTKTVRETLKNLHGDTYHITVMKGPSGQVEVVGLKPLASGSYKIARTARLLWTQQASAEDIGSVFVSAKIRPQCTPEEALKESNIAKHLALAGVPFILETKLVSRPPIAGSPRYGLMSELCRGRDLDAFSELHFSPTSLQPKPEFREQHLVTMYQVVQGLAEIAENGVQHSDLKGGNVLMKKVGDRYEARIIDYGLMSPVGTKIQFSPGTFPPPESQDELVQTGEATITPGVDSWSYGLLLYGQMHNRPDIVDKFAWGKDVITHTAGGQEKSKTVVRTGDEMRSALKELYATLDPNDPVDRLIQGLLNDDPAHRQDLKGAKRILEKILGEQHPDVVKARSREAPHLPLTVRGKSVKKGAQEFRQSRSAATAKQKREAVRRQALQQSMKTATKEAFLKGSARAWLERGDWLAK